MSASLLSLLLLWTPLQDPAPTAAIPANDAQPRGLVRNEPGAFQGYTLFAPLCSGITYLVDMRGETVHTWKSPGPPTQVYLLGDGKLLRASRIDDTPVFHGGGLGGRIQELAPDGSVTWEYVLSDEKNCLHHGFDVLPNGNLLCIAWERLTRDEAIARGRDPAVVGESGVWSDWVFELRPTTPSGGEILWEWHAANHLIQDFDPAKPEHGSVADHSERMDFNGDHRSAAPLTSAQRAEQEQLEAEMRRLGYAGGDEDEQEASDAKPADDPERRDWLHTNSVDYQPATDLILLSVPRVNEVWIIDHSTTTAQARGSSGGRWKRGGDLLYRWGNPKTYGAGTAADQQLYFQHQPEWVSPGLPGAGHVVVFNNGRKRPNKEYSTVDELVLPFDPSHGFAYEPGKAFGPAGPVWSYSDPDHFYSFFVSGCQRLANGNTFVCSGKQGRFFELTPAGEIVWEFWNPYGGDIPPSRGKAAPPPRPTDPPSPVEPTSCFRATRIAPDHPGLKALGVD